MELARRAPLLIEHAGACEDAARVLAFRGRRVEAAPLLAEALERLQENQDKIIANYHSTEYKWGGLDWVRYLFFLGSSR